MSGQIFTMNKNCKKFNDLIEDKNYFRKSKSSLYVKNFRVI